MPSITQQPRDSCTATGNLATFSVDSDPATPALYSVTTGASWFDALAGERWGISIAGDGKKLWKAVFRINNVGPAGAGYLVAKLFAGTGTPGTNGRGTGAALATSTNTVPAGSIGIADDVTFFFPRTLLTNGSPYAVVVEFVDINGGMQLGNDLSNSVPGANVTQSDAGGSWFFVNAATDDARMRVYTDDSTYQWQRSAQGTGPFIDVGGATASTYSFIVASTNQRDQFRCVVTDFGGSVTSAPATLTLGDATIFVRAGES